MPHKNPYLQQTFCENSHQYYIRVTQESIPVIWATCKYKYSFVALLLISFEGKMTIFPSADKLVSPCNYNKFHTTFKCSFPVSEWAWVSECGWSCHVQQPIKHLSSSFLMTGREGFVLRNQCSFLTTQDCSLNYNRISSYHFTKVCFTYHCVIHVLIGYPCTLYLYTRLVVT